MKNLELQFELIKKFGSQVAASEALRIDRTRMSHIVNRHVQLKPDEWDRFAGALGVELTGRLLGERPAEKEVRS